MSTHNIYLLYPVTIQWSGIKISRWMSVCPSILLSCICILFMEDNFSKYQWIFTKLGMCFDIVEIWFQIANGKILSIFSRVICLPHNNGILWRTGSRLLMGKFCQFLTVICLPHNNGILWSSGLRLLMGKFCQFLTVICPPHNSGILWRSVSRLLMGKFCQFLTEISAGCTIVAEYYHFTFLFWKMRKMFSWLSLLSGALTIHYLLLEKFS